MRTARSSSRLLGGGLPQCILGYTPLGVGLETPLARPLNFPLGVGLETPPARSLNLPPGCGPGNLQDMLGYHRQPPPTPLDRIIDTRF